MPGAPSLLIYCYTNGGFTKGQMGPLSVPVLVPLEFAIRGTMAIPSAVVAALWLPASLCCRLLRSIIAPVLWGRPTPTYVGARGQPGGCVDRCRLDLRGCSAVTLSEADQRLAGWGRQGPERLVGVSRLGRS
jgi:hypothetical protein